MASAAVMVVVGRLARDVEHPTANGPYKTALAVDGMIREGKETTTDFIELTIWEKTSAGHLIEVMQGRNKPITKGSQVQVSGEFYIDRYTNREGAKVERRSMEVDRMNFVSSGSASRAPSTQTQEKPAETPSLQLSDEDIPL